MLSALLDQLLVLGKTRDLHLIDRDGSTVSVAAGMELEPAARDLFAGPLGGEDRVHVDDEVEVVVHDAVGGDVRGEELLEVGEALPDPDFPVLEGLAGLRIEPAEAGPADAAGDRVVPLRLFRIDLLVAGDGHGAAPSARDNSFALCGPPRELQIHGRDS